MFCHSSPRPTPGRALSKHRAEEGLAQATYQKGNSPCLFVYRLPLQPTDDPLASSFRELGLRAALYWSRSTTLSFRRTALLEHPKWVASFVSWTSLFYLARPPSNQLRMGACSCSELAGSTLVTCLSASVSLFFFHSPSQLDRPRPSRHKWKRAISVTPFIHHKMLS